MAYKTLIIAAVLLIPIGGPHAADASGGAAATPTGPAVIERIAPVPACEADANLSGLIAALRENGSPEAADAADIIGIYQDERAAHCRQLDAAAREIAALRSSLALSDRLLALADRDRMTLDTAWQRALDRKPQTRTPWLACGPGAYAGVSAQDGRGDYGAALACIFPIWPK